MSAVGSRERRNVWVLAAHGVLVAAGLWVAWAQWAGVAVEEAAARQTRRALEELDRRLGQPRAGSPPASTVADPLLRGQTAALAGANLQDRVVSAIRAAGGTVTTSQIETAPRDEAGAGGGPSLLSLTVAFDLGNNPLQALLYELEGGTPTLFLDRLSIESPDDGRGGALRVSMTVSGYWRGEGHS